jgi:AraC-like DNA-binding protein
MPRRVRSLDSSRPPSAFLDSRRVAGSIRTIRPLLEYLAARGCDTAAMLQAAGVEPSLVDQPEARLPHAVMIRVWEAAGRLTGDQDLGLHAAQAIRPGDFGAMEYVVRTSQTLGAGLARLARYYAVLNDGAEIVVEAQRDRAVWSHRLSYPGGLPRQIPEYVIGCLLVLLRHATGVDWTPLEVRFPHQEPADTSAHRRLFRAPLRFGCERSELVIPRSSYDAPLLGADSALQSLVEAQVAGLLENLPRAEATTDRVRRLLGTELCDGEPTLERLAARLHMSARTLHRHLENEGTTFRRIVTELRRELAERHLRERKLGVGEIAFILGFSEASAFHRAFKRWTGQPPRAYREAIR